MAFGSVPRRRSSSGASPVRAGNTIVVRSGGSAVRRRSSAASRRSSVPQRLARAAIDQRHTLVALGTAVALGYARREGYELPAFGGVGPAATVGLAAWALGHFTGNQTAKHVATGALSIAAYDWAAYDQETRDGIEALLERQRARSDAESAPAAQATQGYGGY